MVRHLLAGVVAAAIARIGSEAQKFRVGVVVRDRAVDYKGRTYERVNFLRVKTNVFLLLLLKV